MVNLEVQFLHQRDPAFHHSPEVEVAVSYLRSHGPRIPNEPVTKLAAHLDFLADPGYVNDGTLTGDHESIERQVERSIVGIDEVSESYFALQRRIAREELGLGDITITPEQRQQMSKMIREDQRARLKEWTSYLNSPDGDYPVWFKRYAFNSAIKLTEYDLEKEQFRRRSHGTAANFPELNQEALAFVYDVVLETFMKPVDSDKPEYDEALQKAAQSGNFAKIYGHAFQEVATSRHERGTTTEGSWVAYESSEKAVVDVMTESLKGHATTWCIAGGATAAGYLKRGQMHIYYSRNAEGEDTIPRIAIHVSRGRVYEVRGVEPGQNVETVMFDIAGQKLAEIPGGKDHQKRVADMQHLTAIDKQFQAGTPPDVHDVFFLREYGGEISSFGYQKDPRIEQLLKGRDEAEDFRLMLTTYGERALATRFMELGRHDLLVKHLDLFEPGLVDQKGLLEKLVGNLEDVHSQPRDFQSSDRAQFVAENLDKFTPGLVNHKGLADLLLLTYKGAGYLADNFGKFEKGAVDRSKLFEMIVGQSSSFGDKITKNIHLFIGYIEPGELTEQLIKTGKMNILARNIQSIELEPDACLRVVLMLAASNYDQALISNMAILAKRIDQATLASALVDNGHARIVAASLDTFDVAAVDHAGLANGMIATNKADVVVANLDKFQPGSVDHAELVIILRRARQLDVIAANLKRFAPGTIDHKAFCAELLAQRRTALFVENIEQFDPGSYDIEAVIDHLIDEKQVAALFRNFKPIAALIDEQAFVTRLVESGNADQVYRNRKEFGADVIDEESLLRALLKSNDPPLAMASLKRLEASSDLALEVVEGLIATGNVDAASNKMKILLAKCNHAQLVNLFIQTGNSHVVVRNISKFDEGAIDSGQFALDLIAQGQADQVSGHISYFLAHGDHQKIADALIDAGSGDVIVRHFKKFNEGTVNEPVLVQSLLASGHTDIAAKKFGVQVIGGEQQAFHVLKLARNGNGKSAIAALKELPPGTVDTTLLASVLIEQQNSEVIVQNLGMFGPDSVDLGELAQTLIQEGKGNVVMTHLDEFGDTINHHHIVTQLMRRGQVDAIVRHIDKLNPGSYDPLTLMERLILLDPENIMTTRLHTLIRVTDPRTMLEAIVGTGNAYVVEQHIDTFLATMGEEALASYLYEIGCGYVVEANAQKFGKLDVQNEDLPDSSQLIGIEDPADTEMFEDLLTDIAHDPGSYA